MTTVPALPVVTTLASVVLAVAVLRLQHRGAATRPRIAAVAVACAYGAGVLGHVLLPFPVHLGAARDDLAPWTVFVQLVPVVTADPIGIVLNVALFVPLGVVLPLLMRDPTAVRVVGAGFLLSLGIEVTQLVADVTVSTGRVADVDDLLGNTLGVGVGYALLRLATVVPAAARAVDAATWPRAGQDELPATADVG